MKQTPNGVHKAPLSPLLNPSVLHVWCLCLDSCTIKAHDTWFTLTVLCSRGYILLDYDKWAYCSYDMFKTQRAMFTVQAFVGAQCFWPDKWEPNELSWMIFWEECHVDTDLLERRHTRSIVIEHVHVFVCSHTWIFESTFSSELSDMSTQSTGGRNNKQNKIGLKCI